MKTRDENESVKVPCGLLAEVRIAAAEDHCTSEDFVREAVEQRLKDRRWRQLLAYGEQQSRALGLTEADVPRLIEEYRRERRQGG